MHFIESNKHGATQERTEMKKKLLRFVLLVVLFCGCLVFSYHLDIYGHHQSLKDQIKGNTLLEDAPLPRKQASSDKHQDDLFQVENNNKVPNESRTVALVHRGDCRWVEPWFNKKTRENVQLIFYGKPIMQVVKRLCVQRHWKMMLILNESNPNSQKELQRLVSSSRDTFTIMFTSSRQYHLSVIQELANSTNALVSSIRYAFKTSGPKKEQLKAFRAHFVSRGCTLEEVGIMPQSFLLDSSQECVQFFKYASSNPTKWWVLKMSQGYGGEGISIHQNMSLLYKKFGICKGNGEYIVQEYLSNLLLVEGRKFDVRGLILIAGTDPYFLFYHESYLRVSVSNFAFNGDRNVHITNSHLQVMSRDFDPEKHFWSFKRFQEFLDTHHPDNEDFVENKLIPFIKNTALFLLKSSKKLDRLSTAK